MIRQLVDYEELATFAFGGKAGSTKRSGRR
jgi:hypothetical protein